MTDYEDEALRAEAQRVGARGYALKMNLLDLPKVIHSATML